MLNSLLKIAASAVAVLVAVLVAAATIEVIYGAPRPGFVPVAALAIASPVLFLIWRKRASVATPKRPD